MSVVSMKQLLEAGVHFGHITQKWHPKMKSYIYGSHSGIYIIDLRQTLQKLKEAYEYIFKVSSSGGRILFAGTKPAAREIIKREALRSNNFYVNHRWLGGMLTNFNTIKQSITKLRKIEDIAGSDYSYEGMIKKEATKLEKGRQKMELVFGGIKDMRRMPAAIFILDIRKEDIALQEANKMDIPVIAVVDTNCSPQGVDYVIPGNDDSVQAIDMYTSIITSASIEGRKVYEKKVKEARQEKEAAKEKEKKSSQQDPKNE